MKISKVFVLSLFAISSAHATDLYLANATDKQIHAECISSQGSSSESIDPMSFKTLGNCSLKTKGTIFHINDQPMQINQVCISKLGFNLIVTDYKFNGSNNLQLMPNGCHYERE